VSLSWASVSSPMHRMWSFFAVKHPLLPEDVRRHIERTAQIRGGSVEELAGIEKVVKDFLENPPDSLDIRPWSSR
jgi:hypothetical protein